MPAARLILRGFALRCPQCGRGRLYRRVFTLRRTCTECGQPFLRDDGDWTGGAEITMLLVSVAAFALFFALTWFTELEFAWTAGIVVGGAAVTMPFVYRHVKGAWVGAVRAWEGPDPEPRPVMEPEWFVEHWEREQER